MFDLPDAKRVRREDVEDVVGSGLANGSGDEGVAEELHAQIGEALGLDLGALAPSIPRSEKTGAKRGAVAQARSETCADQSQDEDLGEFDFRLFSTAGSKAKVVLQSENGAQGEGNIVSKRPPSYYLVLRLTGELRRQYESAAVSGEDVLARSRQRSWGLELPWKVLRMTAAATTTDDERTIETSVVGGGDGSAGRRRPGKKTRIAVRKKDRARKLAEAKEVEKQMQKEEHAKEKKKRLNRAKKLRRRAKDKEKRTAADGGGEAGGTGGSEPDESD